MVAIQTVPVMSIANTIQAAFPFTVVKSPLTGPDGAKTPHFGLFRSDNFQCVGNAVRRTYTPHQTEDIIVLVEAAAQAFGTEVGIQTYWHEGHNLTIAPTAEYRRNIFNTKDNLFPRLVVKAGYKGSCFQASLGMYRDICKNLAIVRAEGGEVSCSIRHHRCLRDRIDTVRKQFVSIVSHWDASIETFKDMDRKKVDIAKFVNDVYETHNRAGMSQRGKTMADSRMTKIVSRILRERMIKYGEYGDRNIVTAWEAFNGVQGYMQHDTRRKAGATGISRAFDTLNNSVVTRAMDLALSV